MTQEAYYNFVQTFEDVRLWCLIYAGVFLVIALINIGLCCNKKTKYRMEFVHTKSCNWFRTIFWLFEFMYLPLILNIAWTGNCKFYSVRDAITLTECIPESESTLWYYIMKGICAGAFVLAIGYNIVLWRVIQHSKISTQFHEQAVQKKEVEYVLGINKIWSTSKFFTFSSYRSGWVSMYHRDEFNLFLMLLVAVEVLCSLYTTVDKKMQVMTALMVFWTLLTIVVRPYRSGSSNLIYILGNISVAMQVVFLSCIVNGFK